jgi:hypothetical protein
MTFRKIVESITAIRHCYQSGMQALGADSRKVAVNDTRWLCGSINLDDCLRQSYPDANRWDYLSCYNRKIYFIEVHPANTSEIDYMIKKIQWLWNWLKQDGADLNILIAQKNPYHWVASGKVTILRNSSQARRLSKSGIPFPVEKLILQ